MGVARAAALALIAALAATASAAPAPRGVDWASGLVTADGVGVADRHAPSPAVARGTSRRGAEDAARRELAALIAKLPIAGGGTVATRAKDPAVRARLDAAVAHAHAVAAEPETDGAWRVTMAVPIEAIRQALAGGPRALPPAGDAAPVAVVVAGASAATPAIGWTFAGVRAAAIFVSVAPAWAASAPHATAKRVKAGAIDLDLAGTTPTAATLFVVVQP